jgi:hypothetical protein
MGRNRKSKPLAKLSVAALSAAVAIGAGTYTIADEPGGVGLAKDLQLARVTPEAGVMTFGTALETGDVGSMRVRVIGPDGNVVIDEKNGGEPVLLDASGLPDGFYRYEMWLFTPEEPAPEGHPEEGAIHLLLDRKTEMFEVIGGQLRTFDRQQEESSQDELGARSVESGSFFGRIASAAIDFVFPSAHAAPCASPCQVESTSTAELQIISDTDGSTNGPWEWEFEVDAFSGQIRLGELGGIAEPFKVDINAPADSILIEGNGDVSLGDGGTFIDASTARIGVGTTTPAETVHVVNISTPGIRLDDTGEGIWTMEENSNDLVFRYLGTNAISPYLTMRESGTIDFNPAVTLSSFNFDGTITAPAGQADTFFYNADSGTSNPDRMFWAHSPGFAEWGIQYNDAEDEMYFQTSASDSFRFATFDFSSREVGIGSGNVEPEAPLHVQQGSGAKLLIENTTATAAQRNLLELRNAGKTRFVIENTGSGVWTFDNSGNTFDISRVGTGVPEFQVVANGNGRLTGVMFAQSFNSTSSREAKQDFETVDAKTMLDKVAALEITEWSYKKGDPERRHIGPVAEEFQEIFGLGDGETINMVDTTGIAFAAIQGLREEVRTRDERIAELEARDQELRDELRELRSLVESLK